MVDFLSNFVIPIPTQEEWELFIDSSSSSLGSGAGELLKSPNDVIAQHAVKLDFEKTNNEAKYKALLSGLRIMALHRVRHIKVFTDSQLITQQISEYYQVKELRIQVYLEEVQQSISGFEEVVVEHIPRTLNTYVDSLARLASATMVGIDHPIIIEVIVKPHPLVEIFEILKGDWTHPIL